jgi:hypothetical protein
LDRWSKSYHIFYAKITCATFHFSLTHVINPPSHNVPKYPSTFVFYTVLRRTILGSKVASIYNAAGKKRRRIVREVILLLSRPPFVSLRAREALRMITEYSNNYKLMKTKIQFLRSMLTQITFAISFNRKNEMNFTYFGMPNFYLQGNFCWGLTSDRNKALQFMRNLNKGSLYCIV